ncbi:maleylpyruvate isomerase family mycothiol-dependent enzyme [Phytohabitans rumicis]|uniref:Mycothiol-dependent maleylpyruvate isomerase metal-binding domain-containing protein n=1 Tax=Phytohabitans rumicis TaxID=1076125 RepID=A0A6V8L2Z9_9ACTN|nr:maleylpyruvate isomerase family mycothiol-dependent enzyme [Phytohabitans rumicis]GFJ87085.1 hypothetical protein Prum_007270 [Phytohabitans rumicis]
MTELNAEQARRAIVEHTRRLAESAAAAGPDAAVPTTPQWTITDLVEHVGQTQHWVAEIIERRITDPTQLPTQMAVLPTDPREWQAWLSQSAQRVASACSDDALDAPVFNAAGDGRPGTRFWMSSVLNETVVHGFDAANAADRPADIDPDIAAALISNHLAMLTSPRGRCCGPSPPTPSGAPGRRCSGWPPTPRTTRAPGSSNGGLTGQRGGPEPSRPM